MAPKDLRALREGHCGIALVLYIDVDEDDIEESWQDLPEVMAIDPEGGRPVLELCGRDSVRQGIALDRLGGLVPEPDAGDGYGMAGVPEPMLEGIAGKPDGHARAGALGLTGRRLRNRRPRATRPSRVAVCHRQPGA